jgi:hypothetical protein
MSIYPYSLSEADFASTQFIALNIAISRIAKLKFKKFLSALFHTGFPPNLTCGTVSNLQVYYFYYFSLCPFTQLSVYSITKS